MKLVKLGLVSLLSASALFAGTYNVDKSHSNVGFKVKHMMVSNVTGKFNEFSGSFEYDEATNTLKSLNGVVKVASIDTDNEKRDNHLRASDFFAADKYPEIKFELSQIKSDKAYGKLTMRDVTSNNIANVNTTGFKQDRAEFQDLMYETLNYTAGRTSQTTINPTGIDVGLGVRISGVQKNFNEGDLTLTSNPLDLAIEGEGFFQITLPSGETAYTRNGSFKVNSEGTIVNGNGYPLSPEIVIPDNVTDLSIAVDGTVSATNPTDGTIVDLGQILVADFINPAGLIPMGESMFMESEASGAVQEGVPSEEQFGSIRQGMIESSNVKLVNEMVDLITAQRAYEANSKAITTTDGMLDTVNRLKN